jgi:phosphonate C-P lyase system protein PhnG
MRPGELVLVRHLGVGGGPTFVQVVRYQLKGRQLIRSASAPLASLAALADALLQSPLPVERLQTHLIAPLAAHIAEERRRKQAEAASTKVEFFTMVRGA